MWGSHRGWLCTGFDMKIYRTIRWGQLANFHMMDTRQYRDDQLAGDGWKKNVTERLAEDRTITGAEQETWLLDGFKNSTQRWDILGQQVFFAERDRDKAPEIDDVSMDGLDGYAASRRRITQGWVDANVRNAVVLTCDVHRNWANDLKVNYKDPGSPVVGSELVCTSITSTGNGTLREHQDHQRRDDRGLPGPGLRHDAGLPRQHEGLLRDPGRCAGSYRWLSLSKPSKPRVVRPVETHRGFHLPRRARIR
ncbi:UNVERIFIED_ORG: phosphodiesterase/alkaline phosphatase D-like protein [Arthrobacter sp. UYCu721]